MKQRRLLTISLTLLFTGLAIIAGLFIGDAFIGADAVTATLAEQETIRSLATFGAGLIGSAIVILFIWSRVG